MKNPSKYLSTLRASRGVASSKMLGIGGMAATLGRLTEMAEGLIEYQANPDPAHSREKRASDYLKKHGSVTQSAARLIEKESAALDDYRIAIESSARLAAGWEKPMNSTEIRQALLRLDVKARDAAVKQIAREGRGEYLAALEGLPEWLWGGTSSPLGTHIDNCLEAASPGYRESVESYEQARRTLEFAAKQFEGVAEELRDLQGEHDAKRAEERHLAAQAKLSSVA